MIPEHFPLDTLGPHLKKLSPRDGPFDPRKPSEQAYGVYTLAGRGGRVGRLLLRRRVGGKGNVALDLQYEKALMGGSQKIAATMHTRDHILAMPRRWSFEAHLVDGGGKPIEHTRLSKSARATDGAIEITDGTQAKRLTVPGDYTVNWALFDAVQRLPGERTKPLRFTLIDHFDQLKPNHTLSHRTTADVTVGGHTLRLLAYDHVGQGIVPWVYWLDETKRLVVAVSGLEAYLLESSRQL
jgi:hypothetical protein